jgi:ATP-binding protein involved in chromosome partitioning
MADNDAFFDAVTKVAGARASAIKVTDGAVSLMLDVSGMPVSDREAMEAKVTHALL